MGRRRVLALGCALAAAGGIAMADLAPAAPGSSAVLASNWYFDDPGMSTTAATQQTTPTTVPKGDLGVGYRDGASAPASGVPVGQPTAEADKLAALNFDLSAAPAGSTVTSFSFTMPIDTNDPTSEALVTGGQVPKLAACLATRGFTAAAGPSTYESAPSYDCSTEAKGVFQPSANAYEFTSTALAQAWVDDVNNGVVILPDPATSNPTTFTLSFEPGPMVTASLAATAPAPGAAQPTAGAATSSTDPAQSQPAAPSRPAAAAATDPAAASEVAPGSSPAAVPAPAGDAGLGNPVPQAGQPAAAEAATAAPDAAATPTGAAAQSDTSGQAQQSQPLTGGQSVPVKEDAATKPVVVTSGFGPFAWVLVVLVLAAFMGLLSLGHAAAPAASAGGASRLTQLLTRINTPEDHQ